MKKKIKLFDPVVGRVEENAIKTVLHSHFWASGRGIENVLKFEDEFRKYIGSNDCIAVNSGTAALVLALSLTDLKNKEVILPSLSFVSTAHAVVLNGGKVRFVDIDPQTLCIDADKVKSSITRKTKAILPVHFAGMACNMNEIMNICNENDLTLIEDAAHAVGTKYNNKKIGTHGFATCFSFHPVKNLAMPTGGMISINDNNHKKIRKILLSRRWCGISNRNDTSYDVNESASNYYMNEFSAAIGLVQLKKLDRMNKKRIKIAKRYHTEINLEQKMPFDNECSYHFYWILVKNRNKFRKKMSECGIETGTHYKPIHQFSFYHSKIKLPITERVGKNIVTIPIHPNLSDNDVTRIINLLNSFS